MYHRAILASLIVCSSLATAALAAVLPPIEKVDGVVPARAAFDDAKRDRPIEVRSKDDAAKYFGDDDLKKLLEKVNFEKQFVLVFAWRGSGRDRLEYTVAESFPEQIFFTIKRGLTRDLRSHTAVYVLRSNVRWSVK
ncbi:MAG: hypothetical protein MI757_19815 [Pirellulales bacterium]|nr:hypothetical protein [Pirellulales bacterium]